MSTEDLRKTRRSRLQRQSAIMDSITNEHIIKLEELCAQLNTDIFDGLTMKAAKQSLKRHGYNVYSKPKKHLRNGTFKNLLFGKQIEQRLDRSWSKKEWNRVFNARSNEQYLVVRDGVEAMVQRSGIVPGDILCLQEKQIVPADARVLQCEGELVVDNRVITGNTGELKTNISTSNDFLLSQNMIFASTEILSGNCKVIVLRTGNETVFGELTQFAQKVRVPRRHGSFSLSSTSSGSSNSIGPTTTRDFIEPTRRPLSGPPSPLYS